jgi:hypothetical protein
MTTLSMGQKLGRDAETEGIIDCLNRAYRSADALEVVIPDLTLHLDLIQLYVLLGKSSND